MPDWEIVNLGVSGYGTDQQYILIQKYFDFYQPDIVFLVFDYISDNLDNTTNYAYGAYYKPYFEESNGKLELKGVPVPKSLAYYRNDYPVLFTSYFVRAFAKVYLHFKNPDQRVIPLITPSLVVAIREFVEMNGAKFVMGFNAMSKEGREHQFCDLHQISCVDLSTDKRYLGHGYHWTPEGHDFVCEKIFSHLSFFFQMSTKTEK
jgi:hypothetical protein